MSIIESQISGGTSFSASFEGTRQAASGVTAGDANVPAYASTSQVVTTARDTRPPRTNLPKRPTVAERQAVNTLVAQALDRARHLENAAETDPMTAAVAGLDLRESLRQLFQLRHVRSDDWATIVNKLQVATLGVEFEEFTRDMANALRMVIESHLGPDADNDDVRASSILLSRNGLDPWKVLAPREKSGQQGE